MLKTILQAFDLANPVFALVVRNFYVMRGSIGSMISVSIIEPSIFIFAFGFGLGSIVNDIGGTPYLNYIVPGMLCYSVLFSASFETGINAFARLTSYRIYDAVLATPATMQDVCAGEVIWAMLRSSIAVTGVLIAAFIFGGVDASWYNVIYALMFLVFGSAAFATFGLAFTGIAKGFHYFSYYFAFWVTPNFLFSGVFFDVHRYPEWLQIVCKALPAYHLVNITRGFFLDQPLDAQTLIASTFYLLVFSVLAYVFAFYKLKNRLFD